MDNTSQGPPASSPPFPPPPPPPLPSSPPTTTIITRSPLSNRSNVELTLWDFKDSSEGQPSPHDSLYDASRVSTSDRAKSPYQTTAVVRPITPPSLRPIDLDSESPLSRLETPFLYGNGTELAPILEQRSIATLRTTSFSTSDVSSLMHGAPPSTSKILNNKNNDNDDDNDDDENNDGSLRTPLQRHHHQQRLRRRQSFSLDDLPLVCPSHEQYEAGDVATESTIGRPRLSALIYAHPTVQVADVHAYPQKPIYPAHQEPRTPPGLATLIEQQQHHRQQQQQQQQQGNRSRSRDPRREQASDPPSTSFDVPFRGQKSGHGNLASHPFMRRHGTSTVGSSSNSRPGVPATTTTAAATATTVGSSSTPPFSSSPSRRPPGQQTAEAHARERPPTPTPAPTFLRSRRTRSSTETGESAAGTYIPRPRPRSRARERERGSERESSHHPGASVDAQPQPSWTCRACHRPADEWWSMAQTVAGHGPGARRGDDWCARCAYRKVVRSWWHCCCCWCGEGAGEKVYV